MVNRIFRGLWMAVLTTRLAGCGGMGSNDPITGITASNFEYGKMATLTLTGNALDNAITVTSDKCNLLTLGNITSAKERQATCYVTGTGSASFTVKSSSGYVVYSTTLSIPEPVTGITASNLNFGQQATVTLSGNPQSSAIALKADKCINISLAAVSNASTRTATCTVVGTGPITFSITGSYSANALYSTKLSATDPAQIVTYNDHNNKYSQKTYVAFPTNGLSNLQLSSTGCDTITLDDGSYANARTATCTLSQTGTVQFEVKRADTTVAQTTSIQVPQPQVTFKTSLGDFVMELNPTAAPLTVKNFMKYVNASFYKNTVFHRIIANTVTQGGSLLADGTAAPDPVIDGVRTKLDPIDLEVGKGLSNIEGSVAMARTTDLNSATSGFFVNLKDNTYYDTLGGGYAVFGKVISGLDLLKQIAATVKPGTTEVPATVVTVTSATQTQ